MALTDAARPGLTPMQTRLCDAALACIERFGLAKTSLEDVATEAQVSRQTIYRNFANRDELLVEALLLELARHEAPDRFDELVRDVHTPEDAVALLIDEALSQLDAIRASPRLSVLLATEVESVRATIDGAFPLLFRHHADDLRPWLELGQRSGFLNPDLLPDEMSEWVLRVTLSLFFTEGPVERGPDELRRYLRTYLTPVLAGPGSPRRDEGKR